MPCGISLISTQGFYPSLQGLHTSLKIATHLSPPTPALRYRSTSVSRFDALCQLVKPNGRRKPSGPAEGHVLAALAVHLRAQARTCRVTTQPFVD